MWYMASSMTMGKDRVYLLVWLLLLITPLLGGPRDIDAILGQTADAIRIVRITIIILLFFVAAIDILLSKSAKVNRVLRGPLGWFLLYGIAAMASSVYSDQQLVSLWKGFEVCVCVIVAIYVYRRIRSYNHVEVFWTLNIAFLFALVLSAYLGLIIAPNTALHQMRQIDFKVLTGIYPLINPNSLAQMSAILCIIFFTRYIRAPRKKRSIALLSVLMLPALVLSYGRTSILALLLSICLLFTISKKYKSLLFTAAVLAIFIFSSEFPHLIQYFEKGTSLYTFSGRFIRWPHALDLIRESPVFGYGFYVASRVIYAGVVEIEYVSTSDNTYFDILLSLGVVGFIPFVLMLYSYLKKLIRSLYSKYRPYVRMRLEIMCVTIIIVFRSLTGPSINILHWNLTVMLALIVCLEAMIRYEGFANT